MASSVMQLSYCLSIAHLMTFVIVLEGQYLSASTDSCPFITVRWLCILHLLDSEVLTYYCCLILQCPDNFQSLVTFIAACYYCLSTYFSRVLPLSLFMEVILSCWKKTHSYSYQ